VAPPPDRVRGAAAFITLGPPRPPPATPWRVSQVSLSSADGRTRTVKVSPPVLVAPTARIRIDVMGERAWLSALP